MNYILKAQDKLELKNREKDLRDYFNSLANKDGKLDIPTFKHVLKQLGLHPEEGIVVETIEEIARKWSSILSFRMITQLLYLSLKQQDWMIFNLFFDLTLNFQLE